MESKKKTGAQKTIKKEKDDAERACDRTDAVAAAAFDAPIAPAFAASASSPRRS